LSELRNAQLESEYTVKWLSSMHAWQMMIRLGKDLVAENSRVVDGAEEETCRISCAGFGDKIEGN
jgi:hypothetical protein